MNFPKKNMINLFCFLSGSVFFSENIKTTNTTIQDVTSLFGGGLASSLLVWQGYDYTKVDFSSLKDVSEKYKFLAEAFEKAVCKTLVQPLFSVPFEQLLGYAMRFTSKGPVIDSVRFGKIFGASSKFFAKLSVALLQKSRAEYIDYAKRIYSGDSAAVIGTAYGAAVFGICAAFEKLAKTLEKKYYEKAPNFIQKAFINYFILIAIGKFLLSKNVAEATFGKKIADDSKLVFGALDCANAGLDLVYDIKVKI